MERADGYTIYQINEMRRMISRAMRREFSIERFKPISSSHWNHTGQVRSPKFSEIESALQTLILARVPFDDVVACYGEKAGEQYGADQDFR